jgi:hypothetical protein
MAQVCLPAGCVDAIRIALVDECSDAAVPGANNGYVFNCFRNLSITKNIEDGDETVLKNDCGRKCWQTKKCDELKDINIELELLNPDYELISLLTGQPLINDGGENIGWYQLESGHCTPWVSVELFEQVPDESCAAEHKYRRMVLPKVRFKLPTDEKEDPFRLVKLEGRTSPAELVAWGDGPFNDSPVDFALLADPGDQTHYMEFFDSTVTDTIEGQCGFVAVPTDVEFAMTYDCVTDIITFTSASGLFGGFSPVDSITFTDNNGQWGLSGPDIVVVNPNTITVLNADANTPGLTWTQAIFNNNQGYVGTWNGSVQIAPCLNPPSISISTVIPAGSGTMSMGGSDLDTVTRFRVFDNFGFDELYYDSAGPNAGLNPPGATVTVLNPSAVLITDPALSGLVITHIQARVDPGSVVAYEWYGICAIS